VTHALHFLSYCDYIYTLRDGYVAEQGTYHQLIAANGEFARLDKEFGGSDARDETETEKPQATVDMKQDVKSKLVLTSRQAATGTGKLEGKTHCQGASYYGFNIGKRQYFSYSAHPMALTRIFSLQGLLCCRTRILNCTPACSSSRAYAG
jgi:ATP-binding cassette subfamily C (CFTR/MRP) protein 1